MTSPEHPTYILKSSPNINREHTIPPKTCTPGWLQLVGLGFPNPRTLVLRDKFPRTHVMHCGYTSRTLRQQWLSLPSIIYRTAFCLITIMASLWETGANAFRALGPKDQQSSGITTIARILVLVAPICRS
ncbi:hypothetical protein AUEXF2481DRAFT_36604 [Aureobasidium subglaciale EXF-2481]|uniref:Uncharacterized protein n=1 Tax=Aureobasidium subglaciale (strain EXF-2481) TaxID=1043005 RepID=A0A074YK11_AURSE|nr:uncharacterized protein AUEXF2481DRAFT_36604 [Aureobasidium subglaciale EXF-2481]KEQ98103.1 hypothetical protein AUEXF2481DRAFT_36604 [Aureobasidium subglaciale EXF-2481]